MMFAIYIRNLNDRIWAIGKVKLSNLTRAGLVEASACASASCKVFEFALADSFGVGRRVLRALLLFGRAEDALFGAADALMRVHAFKQKLGCADGGFRRRFASNLQRSQLLDESLYLLQLGE